MPRKGRTRAGETCELCSAPIGERHAHVAELAARRLLCACAACSVLFRESGGRYRTLPERVRTDANARWSDAEWAELGIPVGLVFVMQSSLVDRVWAIYPSPAGAVESELPDASWEALRTKSQLFSLMEPDVEAVLVHRPRRGAPSLHLVPIDVCYSLVGLVRTHWKGFDGGDDARKAIDDAVRALDARAELTPLRGSP